MFGLGNPFQAMRPIRCDLGESMPREGIPAYAGMTWVGAGMTWVGVGMRRAGGYISPSESLPETGVSVVMRRSGRGGGWGLVCFVHGGISLGCGFAEWL